MINYETKNVNKMAKRNFPNAVTIDYNTTEPINRFRKSFAQEGHKPNKETNVDQDGQQIPSQTIPGQAMSIGEMLKRTQAGLPINNNGHVPIYNGERYLPKWKDLDLIDRAKIKKEAEEKVKELESRKKTIEARIEKRKAERAKAMSEKGDISDKKDQPKPDTQKSA